MCANTAGPSAPFGTYGSVFIFSTNHPLISGRTPYTKPHLDVLGQIKLLKRRGMVITDEAKAALYLERIGYYRLSGYWYPLRQGTSATDARGKTVSVALDDFRPGTEFRQALDLYVFDKRLRLIMLDAIERVEVGLRVDVSLLIGARDPWAHRNPSELHPDFAVKPHPRTNLIGHREWLLKQDKLAARSKEEFVEHFRKRYVSPLPIWMAIELWDFGLLSVLVHGLRHADQDFIAAKYGLPRRELLTTWLRAINHVRNICAHHGRLWNRSPSDQPKRTRMGEVPMLDHIASDAPQPLPNKLAPVRLYATAAAIQYLLRRVNPTSSWSQRLKDHLAGFPMVPATSVEQAGFPPGWQTLPLWN